MLATRTPFDRASAACIDFTAGFKTLSNRTMRAALDEAVGSALAMRGGTEPATVKEAEALLASIDFWRWYKLAFRMAQEMMWASVEMAVQPCRQAWLQALEEPQPLGAVRLHPERPLPAWTLEHEIHLQPGSFHADPLAGPIYEIGARLHFLGTNDDESEQRRVARTAPARDYRRILDLGCGPGRSTLPFKQLYPQAEVWGIEIAAPLLRYAHVRANSLGADVHFEQMDAAELLFPDEHFDLVAAHLVFHEMPAESRARGLREAYRVLVPGGVFLISDLAPYRTLTPLQEAVLRWQHVDAGEPFSDDYEASDVAAQLREIGFAVEERGAEFSRDRGRPGTHIYLATKA